MKLADLFIKRDLVSGARDLMEKWLQQSQDKRLFAWLKDRYLKDSDYVGAVIRHFRTRSYTRV